MSPRARKIAFGALIAAIGGVLLWAYLKYVWFAPTLTVQWKGEPDGVSPASPEHGLHSR